MSADLMPFVGSIGGGFFVGLLAGYAIKKILKIAAVIVGLFIAALAFLEFQRIIDVNWAKMQAVSQNGLTWVAKKGAEWVALFMYRIILVMQEHYQILEFR
jgi:uncharacterized membrane protein (Fun14 family)